MDFKTITPQDKEIFNNFYPYKTSRNAETAFANLCCYNFLYHGEYTVIDNCLLTRIHFDYGKNLCYYLPIGKHDRKEVIELLIKDSITNNYQLNVVVENEEINNWFDDKFEISSHRSLFDYLYKREDLMLLSGKSFQKKRNHINQFMNLYHHSFRQLKKEDKQECLDMNSLWFKQEMLITPEFKQDYMEERRVIEYLFDYFDELDMFGGAIMVEGKMIAFSLGSKVTNDTFDTHIEKANRDYIGSYAIINKEMATNIPQEFTFINREEDKGIIGLRKAKLSYQPYKLIEKYLATYKKQ
jgi:hypothetical protein